MADPANGNDTTNDTSNDLIRVQDFDTPGPIELDIGNGIGPIDITLTDSATTHVTVRHDPNAGFLDWRGGLTGLLSWVTEQFSESGFRRSEKLGPERDGGSPISEAIEQTRIDLTGNRLVVRTPTTVPLRAVPLSISVAAPVASQVSVRTGAGAVRITGTAGRLQIQSGAGAVTTDRVTGPATVRSGSGPVRLGGMGAGVQLRSGSGDVEIASVEAASSIVTGSGGVWLGVLEADVLVRSGSGDVTIADATSGEAELITGSGELRVSVHRGSSAEIDLTSSTGRARSELPVQDDPPDDQPTVRIFGRTGNGDVLLTATV